LPFVRQQRKRPQKDLAEVAEADQPELRRQEGVTRPPHAHWLSCSGTAIKLEEANESVLNIQA
jgi:hypothetical protein